MYRMQLHPLPTSARLSRFVPLLALCLSASLHAQMYSAFDLGDYTRGGTLNNFLGEGGLYELNNAGTVVGGYRFAPEQNIHAYAQNGVIKTDLGVSPYGSVAGSINQSGTIVGGYQTTANGNSRPFSYSNGVMTDLTSTFGGDGGVAWDINNTGTVVGYNFTLGTPGPRAVSVTNGVATQIGSLSGTDWSWAIAVNNSNAVVGTIRSDSGATYGFRYENGVTKTLTSGNIGSQAIDINDAGVIVGGLYSGSVAHAFIYSDGNLQELGSLFGSSGGSVAYNINNAGVVVGTSFGQNPALIESRAFVYTDGTMLDLNSLVAGVDGTLVAAQGVNDLGQIIAISANRAYLLTPIPEPSTYAALLGVAVLGVALVRRRSRTAA